MPATASLFQAKTNNISPAKDTRDTMLASREQELRQKSIRRSKFEESHTRQPTSQIVERLSNTLEEKIQKSASKGKRTAILHVEPDITLHEAYTEKKFKGALSHYTARTPATSLATTIATIVFGLIVLAVALISSWNLSNNSLEWINDNRLLAIVLGIIMLALVLGVLTLWLYILPPMTFIIRKELHKARGAVFVRGDIRDALSQLEARCQEKGYIFKYKPVYLLQDVAGFQREYRCEVSWMSEDEMEQVLGLNAEQLEAYNAGVPIEDVIA